MNKKRMFHVATLILAALNAPCAPAPEQSPTGFYYPTGRAPSIYDTGWLASDEDYFDDLCHIGHDFKAEVNDPVYPICDGEVLYISYTEAYWGTGNMCVLVKHALMSGHEFVAFYGHMKVNDLAPGDKVYAGIEFGKVGYYKYGTHIHLGIYPNLNYPSTNWGRIPSPGQPPYNGFVDPIEWLNTQVPKSASFLVVQFPPSSSVYLYSNSQLWPIPNEEIYCLLGFGMAGNFREPDWSHVLELPESEKANYF